MARNREFDEQAVRQAILMVFWEHGYDATNLSQLEAATGLVRTSLYNAFGSKSDMFADALARYHDTIDGLFRQIPGPDGLSRLRAAFSAMVDRSDDMASWPAGCLMVSSASQGGTLEAKHVALVRGYRAGLVAHVAALLDMDQREGRLLPTLDIADAAEFLVCTMWGALVSACIAGDDANSKGSLTTLDAILASWRTA